MRDEPLKPQESGAPSGLRIATLFEDPTFVALYSGPWGSKLAESHRPRSNVDRGETDSDTIDCSIAIASLDRRPPRLDSGKRDSERGVKADAPEVRPAGPEGGKLHPKDAAIHESLKTLLAGKTGLPDRTTTKVAGVGSISVEARRHADTHRIEGLTIKLPVRLEGTPASQIDVRHDARGGWSIADYGKLNLGQRKVLETMGIKPNKDGRFSGELEILKNGTVRYKDSDMADRKTYGLKPDGGRSIIDHKTNTVTKTDAAGKVSRLGWNGGAFAELKPGTNPKVDIMPDGSTKVTLSFANVGGRPPRIAQVERITGGTNRLDRTVYTQSNPRAPGGLGSAHAYDWHDGTRHMVKDDRGRPTKPVTEYHDGKTYRLGTKTGDTATGTTVTLAGSDRGSGVKSISTRGDVRTFKGEGFELDKDKENRVTRIKNDKGTMMLGRDTHGDINRMLMPDGRTLVRIGPERQPGIDYRLSRGEANLNELARGGKFNEWLVFDKEGKYTGNTKFNFGVSLTGEARFAHEPPRLVPPRELRPPRPERETPAPLPSPDGGKPYPGPLPSADRGKPYPGLFPPTDRGKPYPDLLFPPSDRGRPYPGPLPPSYRKPDSKPVPPKTVESHIPVAHRKI
ncbi:MAG: hypothetical protein K2X93_20920 [Candidatus Obscuribacterales bacterium]|nr:hypothetical protein [Candidatus Obscuribacterales bacterium]